MEMISLARETAIANVKLVKGQLHGNLRYCSSADLRSRVFSLSLKFRQQKGAFTPKSPTAAARKRLQEGYRLRDTIDRLDRQNNQSENTKQHAVGPISNHSGKLLVSLCIHSLTEYLTMFALSW